jgi:hypothetical protein
VALGWEQGQEGRAIEIDSEEIPIIIPPGFRRPRNHRPALRGDCDEYRGGRDWVADIDPGARLAEIRIEERVQAYGLRLRATRQRISPCEDSGDVLEQFRRLNLALGDHPVQEPMFRLFTDLFKGFPDDQEQHFGALSPVTDLSMLDLKVADSDMWLSGVFAASLLTRALSCAV